MKKPLLWLLIMLLSVSMIATFSLAGCKKEAAPVEEEVVEEAAAEEVVEEEAAPAEEPYPSTISGKVECMTPFTGGASAEGIELVAAKFREAYPNIELTMIPKSGEEAWTSVLTNLASNNPWDVIIYWPKGFSQPLVDQGLVAPLTDIFKATKFDEIAKGSYDVARYIGKGDTPYNVPINSHMFAVFYNVAKFKEAGIDKEPETWDEFLADCKMLMDKGIYPIGKNTGDAGLPHWSWMDKFMNRTLADDSYRKQLMVGEGSWDTPEFRNADNYWDDIMPYWNPDSATAQYGDAYAMFARGDIAMQCIGSWICGPYEVEMGMKPIDDYNAFLFPEIDPSIPMAETVSSNCILLSNAKKDNIAAQAWIAFWCRPEISKLFNDYIKTVSPISSASSSHPILNKLLEESKNRPLYFQWLMDTEVHGLIDKEVESRSLGNITQDEEIINITKVIDDWKAKKS